LPAGPRGRPEGGHRGLPRDPLPPARHGPRPRGLDRRARQTRRQVGRADGDRDGRRQLARARASRRGGRRRRPDARPHERARIRRAGARAAAGDRGDDRERLVEDHDAAPVAAPSGSEAPPPRAHPAQPDLQRRFSVIAFGSAISGADAYRRYAEPGIRGAAEPGSRVLAVAAVEPIGRTYNLILGAAAALEYLEALVLVHPHTEVADPLFCAKVREALSDPEVGLIGCAGARG